MIASLAPVVNDLSRPYWNGAAEGRLVLPHCVETGQPFWPPAPASPFRTAGAIEWREIKAAGVLLSLVVYRRAFQAALVAQLPYGVALIEVSPNVRLMAHVRDPDVDFAPTPGTPVDLCFRPLVRSDMPVLTVSQARELPA
jgi:uncharacterized protein